jgi:LDH2 family malate/lactate/ureidoglycolate dehydrogenase
MDADGNETRDPNAFYGPPMGKLLPFGGPVGYKGYALSLLVELLGGALAGETPTGADRPVNSMWLIVVDPDRFLAKGRYETLASEVAGYMKSALVAAGGDHVRVPGEAAFARLRAAGDDPIVELDAETWRQLEEAGRQMGIEMRPKEVKR